MSEKLSKRENEILFREADHVYIIHGNEYTTSVSKVLSRELYDDFDSQAYFDKKRASADQRNKEQRSWAWTRERGTAIHLKIEQKLNQEEDNPDSLYKWSEEHGGLTVQEINQFNLETETTANVMIHQIQTLFSGWTFLASEYRIFGKLPFMGDLEIPGTIDALFYVGDPKDRNVVIVDWKTNKQMNLYKAIVKNEHSPFYGEKKCSLDKYFCQLHIYKYILENNYNVKVVGLYIFHCSPESDYVTTIYAPKMNCKCVERNE